MRKGDVQVCDVVGCVFLCKKKTAYEMRIRDWSSDVGASDLDRSAGEASGLEAPRARAYARLGAAAIQDAHPGHGQSKRILEEFGEQLLSMLHISRRPDWAWFEAVLSYDNADRKSTRLNSSH